MAATTINTAPVDYRSVPWYPADKLRVGSNGTVQKWQSRSRSWHTLKPFWNRALRVEFRIDGRRRRAYVSTLVCRAFHGPRPLGNAPFHYPDTDRRNCTADNLRWAPKGTQILQNTNGAMPRIYRGSLNKASVLDDETVLEMRELRRQGCSYGAIAAAFDIAHRTAYRAVIGETWAHVPGAVSAREH
jgi:hypothetical protein